MNASAPALIPTLALPMPLLPENPGAEPQSLVMAVELGLLAQRWRRRWPELRLSLPAGGTWPLLSWPEALQQALDTVLADAVQWQDDAAVALDLCLRRGALRVDLDGDDAQARRWLPQALLAAQRLAAWQGGRLRWRTSGAHWKVRLELPFSPARR